MLSAQEDVEKLSERELPLTDLRIKEKIIKLNAVKVGEVVKAYVIQYRKEPFVYRICESGL